MRAFPGLAASRLDGAVHGPDRQQHPDHRRGAGGGRLLHLLRFPALEGRAVSLPGAGAAGLPGGARHASRA
ncbi:hypothetical protein LP420_21700 [Massilia sp. B-10]|nr:hypothetical protein LP420_21700 [Massilia sp. B-10]